MKFTISTVIDRPVAGVWRWYAVEHVRNHPRWDPKMELEQISEGPIGLGSRIRRRNHHFDQTLDGEMEIVEWEPERVMAARIKDANVETIGRVTFEPLGPSKTRLSLDVDYPTLDPSEVEQLRRSIEKGYATIRRMMESEI
jgi:hypothetical protein